jgi:hypothetical protein
LSIMSHNCLQCICPLLRLPLPTTIFIYVLIGDWRTTTFTTMINPGQQRARARTHAHAHTHTHTHTHTSCRFKSDHRTFQLHHSTYAASGLTLSVARCFSQNCIVLPVTSTLLLLTPSP